jgi:hypothetical protein
MGNGRPIRGIIPHCRGPVILCGIGWRCVFPCWSVRGVPARFPLLVYGFICAYIQTEIHTCVYTCKDTHTYTRAYGSIFWRRWSRIQWIDPSGAMQMLPPENPDEIFARKVEYLRAQEAKAKAEEAAIQKAEEKAKDTAASPAQPANEFAWKEGVDALRGAVEHAHQLSGMLGLMSSRALKVSRISPCVGSGGHAVMLALEAKLHALSRASRQHTFSKVIYTQILRSPMYIYI